MNKRLPHLILPRHGAVRFMHRGNPAMCGRISESASRDCFAIARNDGEMGALYE